MPPEKMGRYEIVRELGHGAMGVVYEALDPTIGRRIALKAIRFDGIGTTADEAARRFKNEARAAGGLNHPNLVTVYDAGEDAGNLYLAMEFIEGSNLDELLRNERRLSPAKATDIVRQVCAGLDFAHSKGIVHRDIKPANVMLGAHGLVKITDFGIARAGEAMTLTGQVIGTPNYMSPEQVLGKTLDGRSDLFSVGVMLYEMITGERPFEGQSITTIMYKIVHETPIPPRKLDAGIHPGLSAVIEKSLAKPPEERFPTGAELTKALENYQSASLTPSAVLDIPTLAVPIPNDLKTQPNPSSTQPAPSSGAGASAQTVAPGVGGFFARLSPKARKRLIAAIVISGVYIVSRLNRHERAEDRQSHEAQTSSSSAAPSPAPPPTVTQPAAPSTQETQTSSQPLTERENATDSKTTALLNVNSNPPGADIEIDGQPTGKNTPSALQLPRGQHSVSVHMEGFTPASASFKVKGGEEIEYSPQLSVALNGVPMPNINIPDLSNLKEITKETQRQSKAWQQWALQQQQGTTKLVITSTPLGARILIDGNDSGHTTPAMIPTDPGKHHVRLELDGYQPAEHDLNVKQGKPAAWTVTLKSSHSEN